MALKVEDRVRETTTTEGTGAIALGGAVTNFETFSANLSNSDTTYYAIVDNTNNAFEVGLGTYASSGNTLTRTTIIESSNSNNVVSLATGTKDVFITVPGDKTVYLDASGNLVKNGGTISFDLVNDTSPQLGGALDVVTHDIVTTSNRDLELAPNGTGKVVVKGNSNQGAIKLNCEANSHGQTIIAAPHSESANNTLTLPSTGGDARLVSATSTATLTNKTFGDNVSFGDNNITNVGDIAVDSISPDGTDINVAVSDNSATAFTIKQGSDNYLIVDTANSSESVAIGTGVSGTALSLGHTTSETTVNDNLTVTGDLTVNGTTTTVHSTTLTVDDPIITLGGNSAPGSDDNKDRGVEFRYHTGSAAKIGFFGFDDSGTVFTFIPDATNSGEVFSGSVGNVVFGVGTFGSLDVSGNVDVDGILEADAMTLNGTSITTTATLSTGISNGNVLVANANVVNNDFLRVDGTSIEGLSASEVSTQIGAATTDDIIALSIALG
jgi:hypothetical protein